MIAITGGAGFIGSALVWKFNALGEKDILVVDQDAENSPKWKNLKKSRFSRYLGSDEFLAGLGRGEFNGKIRAVFHMGACSDTTEKDVSYLKRNNTGYSQKIAEWCVSQNVYLGYASSAATYGDGRLGFSDEDTLTPRLKALNPYGRSKLDFDIWVLKQGLQNRLLGFRFFNVYGPNEYHKGHMRSLVDKGFEQVRSTGKLRLFKSYRKEYADGGQKRDFLYVKDAVEAMLWFYGHPEIKGIYNLGRGKAQSWNELADALFKASAKPMDIEYVDMPEPIKDQYQYFTQADLSKFKKTGCPVRFKDLEAGVRDYVQNHLAQPDPYL